MKIKLIANPIAGGDARTQIDKVRSAFIARGAEVDLVLTAARGDARQAAAAARDGGYDRIVAAGGDGTLNEVLNGLYPATIPVAFIPLGTVNVLALELGIPFDLAAATAVAVDGALQRVTLGAIGEEKFLLMAGIGFDAAVVRTVSSRLKRRIGRFAYVAAALQILCKWQPPALTVTLDDGRSEAAESLIVGNGRLYGGRFSLTPGARLGAPDFEVLILRRAGRLALLRILAAALCGVPPRPADGLRLRTTRLNVAGEAAVQIDGDDPGPLPLQLRAIPGAAVLVVPATLPEEHR